MVQIRLILFLSLSLYTTSLFPKIPDKKPIQMSYTILGLGDSITEGGADAPSYLCPLWKRLFCAEYEVEFIGPKEQKCRIGQLKHAGYSGQNIEYLELIIDSIYYQHPADIVLIHSGHNHFVEEKPVPGMIATYKSVFKKLKNINPDVKILIAQVIKSGKLPKYSYIPELNQELARLVDNLQDPNIILVDQYTHFEWEKHAIADKVHPNEEGAKLIAGIWFDALIKILPSPTSNKECE